MTQTVRFVRGNDITLRANCYKTQNEEVVAIDLKNCDITVIVSMLQGGIKTVPFSIVEDNTLELYCTPSIFPVAGSYSLDITIIQSLMNIRFATRAAIQVVEYSNELCTEGSAQCGENSVIYIQDQVACGEHIRLTNYVGVQSGNGGAVSEELAALRERVEVLEIANDTNSEAIKSSQEEVNEVEEKAAQLAEEINGIKEVNSLQDKAISTLQSANEATLAEFAKLKEDVANIDGEVKVVAEEQEKQSQINNSVSASMQEMGNVISEIQQKEAQQDTSIADLGEQVEKNKEEVNQQLEQVMSDIDATLTGYVEGLAVFVEKIDTNTANIATLEGVVAANKAEVDELKAGIGEQIVPLINQVMTSLGDVSNAVEQQGIAIEGINAQLQGIDTALTNILGEEV